MNAIPTNGDYPEWLEGIKRSVRNAQGRVALASNRAMILVYWEIGRGILQRQVEQGWGKSVVERLSADLSSAFPRMKGFSIRNLNYMRAFAAAWPDRSYLQDGLADIPWHTQIALLSKVDDPDVRWWYACAVVEHGWTRDTLVHHVATKLHERHGRATHNSQPRCRPSLQGPLRPRLCGLGRRRARTPP